jgi:DNA invertase Pin-like site-specific DNA recombinase
MRMGGRPRCLGATSLIDSDIDDDRACFHRLDDAGISGGKGRDQRAGFDRLMQGIARREFDMVAAWSVDRLSRSLSHLVAFLGEIHGKGIDLYLHTQGLDTSTPTGKAMFQLLGVFAELERSIITERINAGIARAKAAGKHCGCCGPVWASSPRRARSASAPAPCSASSRK